MFLLTRSERGLKTGGCNCSEALTADGVNAAIGVEAVGKLGTAHGWGTLTSMLAVIRVHAKKMSPWAKERPELGQKFNPGQRIMCKRALLSALAVENSRARVRLSPHWKEGL